MNQVMNDLIEGVRTDCSGKWVSVDDLESLVFQTVMKCASVAYYSSDTPQAVIASNAIQDYFEINDITA